MASLPLPEQWVARPSRRDVATVDEEERLRDHFMAVHRHVLERGCKIQVDALVLAQSDGTTYASLSLTVRGTLPVMTPHLSIGMFRLDPPDAPGSVRESVRPFVESQCAAHTQIL